MIEVTYTYNTEQLTHTVSVRARDLSEVIRNVWDTAAEVAEETGATPELEYIVWCEGGDENSIWMRE